MGKNSEKLHNATLAQLRKYLEAGKQIANKKKVVFDEYCFLYATPKDRTPQKIEFLKNALGHLEDTVRTSKWEYDSLAKCLIAYIDFMETKWKLGKRGGTLPEHRIHCEVLLKQVNDLAVPHRIVINDISKLASDIRVFLGK